MDSCICIDKEPGKKKLHQNKSWHFYVLDLDDSDDDSTIAYETPVPQHKDSLYYSESKEAEILEEGKAKICHQEENLEFLQTINIQYNDHVPDDVEDI
jgi:glutamate mutase epsilon subunit